MIFQFGMLGLPKATIFLHVFISFYFICSNLVLHMCLHVVYMQVTVCDAANLGHEIISPVNKS